MLSIGGNTSSDIPEPSGLAIFGLGLLGVSAAQQRRRPRLKPDLAA
jgi:hypothetical protein